MRAAAGPQVAATSLPEKKTTMQRIATIAFLPLLLVAAPAFAQDVPADALVKHFWDSCVLTDLTSVDQVRGTALSRGGMEQAAPPGSLNVLFTAHGNEWLNADGKRCVLTASHVPHARIVAAFDRLRAADRNNTIRTLPTSSPGDRKVDVAIPATTGTTVVAVTGPVPGSSVQSTMLEATVAGGATAPATAPTPPSGGDTPERWFVVPMIGSAIAYDAGSVTETGYGVKAIVVANYTRTPRTLQGTAYHHEVRTMEFDCTTRNGRTLAVGLYDAGGALRSLLQPTDGSAPWIDYRGDAVWEALHDVACRGDSIPEGRPVTGSIDQLIEAMRERALP